MMEPTNVDPQEISKFNTLASRWWDPDSEFKPLHQINPLRLNYIDERAGLAGRRVIDVGCGGGILSESMAQRGAHVTGIDLAEAALGVAKLHLLESGQKVEYVRARAEDMAAERAGEYDVVTCLEMLEHVPDPQAVVAACHTLVKPDGHVFFSTINRNAKAFVFAILGAEYVLRLLPRGTHEYAKFIRPSELEGWARGAGLAMHHITGMQYNPLSGRYRLGGDVAVNYLVHCQRLDEAKAR